MLTFKHAKGLNAKGELSGFEVAGADGQWQPADAKIDGETVIAVFLCCSNKAHDIAFVRFPGKDKFHHASFLLGTWEEVLRAADDPKHGARILGLAALVGGGLKLLQANGLRVIPDAAGAGALAGREHLAAAEDVVQIGNAAEPPVSPLPRRLGWSKPIQAMPTSDGW